MTLRVRLAIGAAFLAALSALSVAGIGYLSTQQQINSEVNQSVTNVLQRFTDPDGRLVDALCKRGRGFGDGADDVDAGLLGGAPGVTLQCLNTENAVLSTVGPSVEADLALCRSEIVGQVGSPIAVGRDDGRYKVASLKTASGFCVTATRSLAETDRALHSVRNRSAAVGLLVTLIAAIGGLLAARQATRPIEHLTRTAEHIARTDDLDVDLPNSGHGEVGRLANAFSIMLRALRISRQQQQQLIQDAGHELRTPLTSIRTNIDTLDRYPDIDNVMRERISQDIHSELDEMRALVDELVLLGVDPGQRGDPINTRLADLVSSVVGRWRQRTKNPIMFETDTPDVTTPVYVVELTRAISNLLDNAIKFSKPESRIEVTVHNTRIVVRDYGTGVDSIDITRIFDRFYRATSARSLPGSGLGLSIVAQVAELHGGTVSVDNDDEGGAIFTLELPPEPPENRTLT